MFIVAKMVAAVTEEKAKEVFWYKLKRNFLE